MTLRESFEGRLVSLTSGGPSPLGLTSGQYAEACVGAGLRGGAVGAFERYRACFRGVGAGAGCAEVGPVVRTQVSESAEGRVVKFAQSVPGRACGEADLETESVVIPMIGRKGRRTYTLCVSSQIGCAMGCGFCQTAQMGLIRSLTPAEIVGQWFAAAHMVLPDERHGLDQAGPITNVVFMGMGEPLDNLDNVVQAIAVLTDHRGPELAMSKITVSTVGRIDGIRRLAAQVRNAGWHRLGLAVSLNAANDRVRSSIMPINRAMPLADLRGALVEWPIYGGFKFCLEYVLIPGVNNTPGDAAALADFVLGRGSWAEPGGAPCALPGLINVIPYNPRDNSPWPAPDEADVDLFLLWLAEAGVYAKRRRTKGRDTMAACGQLGNPALRRKPGRLVEVSGVAPSDLDR